MPNNNFLPFDTEDKNILSDIEYSTNTTRINGISTGEIASSKLHNKLFKQLSTMVYEIANFIVDKGYDADDFSGTLKTNLENAIRKTVYESMTPTSNGGGVQH